MFGKKKEISQETVLAALGTVIEPELHRDLVSLNMIRNLEINGQDVSFTIMLTTPACPLRGKMEGDSRAALSQLPGIGNVTIKWDAQVPVDRRLEGAVGQNFKNVIAVASGKGGVGKSTVSVNLAIALAQKGARVGLLDADILGPNLAMMMGLEGAKLAVKDRKMVPLEQYGVHVISMAFLSSPDKPMIWRGPMLASALKQFLTDVAWDNLDYLVIDLPPGTGDVQLSLAQAIPLSGAVIVTQPMQVAVSDALRGLKMFEKLDVPIIGVVENMSGDFFGTGAGEALANEQSTSYLGSIPMDAEIRKGGDSGQPIVIARPDSEAAQAFQTISEQVAARVSVLTLAKQKDFIPIQMIG